MPIQFAGASNRLEALALMMDWFPTFAEMAGIALPGDRDFDGESILPVLKGQGKRKGKEFLYFDGALLECYRQGDWKLKLPFKGFKGANWKSAVAPHDTLLFNLRNDPGERENLSATHPEKVKDMLRAMEAYRASKGEFPPSLDIGHMADHSHYDFLEETYGENPNYVDWPGMDD
jgi:arylsulfatase A-like enzyme